MVFVVLRSLGGAVLFRGLRPSPSLGVLFWPFGLTHRSYRSADGSRLASVVITRMAQVPTPPDQSEFMEPELTPIVESTGEGLVGTLIGFSFWFIVLSFVLTIVTLGKALPLLFFSIFAVLPISMLGCSALCWRVFHASLRRPSVQVEAVVGSQWARLVGLLALIPAVVLLALSGGILTFAWHKL